MSKKGKIISLITVLAVALSLVAVIPAGFAGASVAGTVQLSRSVYSLSTSTGDDDFGGTSQFDTVTVRVISGCT